VDKPEMCRVLEVREEGEDVKTIRLEKTLDAEPGQFVMLWLPGVEEKPFSLSRLGGGIEVTFDKKGPFTEALYQIKKGDRIGVRGPYGNGWKIRGEKVCIVAGGLGLAPLMPLIESDANLTVIHGVRNKGRVMFKERLEKSGVELHYSSDDGSFGKHCYACDILSDFIKASGFDQVLCCGPEILMKKVVDICKENKVACQVSLERYMKCGIGICGSCAFGSKGLRVCVDGPVFEREDVEDGEFTAFHLDKSGAKSKL
jgi:dihydroorotate dehydrogenase electron transfer subunit